jgi:hypothetical protein
MKLASKARCASSANLETKNIYHRAARLQSSMVKKCYLTQEEGRGSACLWHSGLLWREKMLDDVLLFCYTQ